MTVEGSRCSRRSRAALDEPNVTVATKHIATFANEYAKQVAATDERALDARPPSVDRRAAAEVRWPPVRSASRCAPRKQVGRNDPCPCGSGLKYKKCCADKPVDRGRRRSRACRGRVPDDGGRRMTPEHVAELALRDLARVDLARASQPASLARRRSDASSIARRVGARRARGRRSRRAKDTNGRRGRCAKCSSSRRCGAARRARARARREAAAPARSDLALELVADPADAWRDVARPRRARRRERRPARRGTSTRVRAAARAPSLGILAARACIGTLQDRRCGALLEAVEDVRDRLNLPPGDPAWDVLDALAANKRARAARPTTPTRPPQLRRVAAALRRARRRARAQPRGDARRSSTPRARRRPPRSSARPEPTDERRSRRRCASSRR